MSSNAAAAATSGSGQRSRGKGAALLLAAVPTGRPGAGQVTNGTDTADPRESGAVCMPLPATTYKFSGLSGQRHEWMRALIVDSKLYFAPPSSFNDPLDCRVPPSFQASKLKIETFWRKRQEELDRTRSLTRSQRKAEIQKWVTLSRTPDGQASLAEGVFESIDNCGIACFSEDPRSMLLWSYYAEGHAGVAVRFNTAASVLAQITHHVLPLRVGYQDDFPKISYYAATRADLITTVLGTKSRAWAHEQEWRLVLVGRTASIKIPAAMIDGVVLGMRIDPSHEEAVRAWIDERTPQIELLRVIHKPGSFALDVVPA